MRRWLSVSVERNGWLATAKALKDLCGWLRASALEQKPRKWPASHHFPKRLAYWLNRTLDTKGKLAFSRVSRALPCAPESMCKQAVSQHLRRLFTRHVTDPELLQDIKHHVYTLMKGAFQQRTSYSVPSSSAAVVEAGRESGGYSSYIQSLSRESWVRAAEPGYLRGGRPRKGSGNPERSRLASDFERRLSLQVRRDAMEDYPTLSSARRNQASATAWLLRSSRDSRKVHHTRVIAELGMKARVITVAPAAVFAQGDLVRQIVWPRILERVPQILPYAPHTEEGILARVWSGYHESKVFLSADLTCATDGFGHDAILAVVKGLERAGLQAHLVTALAESLGVGRDLHYVRYRLSDMDPSEAEFCRKTFDVVEGCVEVPKVRGSLMGTPCSFLILSLLNHWMSDGLGRHRIICGDDLAAVTHPSNVLQYSARARGIGSELHEGKSFRSKIGFVFCEAFGLRARDSAGLSSFRPPSLKEFVRNGNGIMSQHSVDPSSFNRLARCARTIYRSQRKIAMKKRRPAELPASLGGLGHPCKGRLRVPIWCRRALWELYLCESAEHAGAHDPTKFVRPLIVPSIPADRRMFRESRSRIEEFVANKQVPLDSIQPGDNLIPNEFIDTYVSMSTNVTYLGNGGKNKRVRTPEIKPGKLRWPKPCANTGVLSTHTRISQVLAWDRRARCELGHHFPPRFSAHIRKRILAYRQWELAGDVGY